MRKIYICCFFLITAFSILNAAERETLYRWSTSEGPKWMQVGDKTVHDHYQGEVKNGLPDGQGKMEYITGKIYAGEWEIGQFHGLGTLIRIDGSVYIGYFEKGLSHGLGKKQFPDGKRIEGKWKKGTQWNVTYYNSKGAISEKIAKGEVVREVDYGDIRYREWQKDHWVWLEIGKTGTHGKFQGEVQGILPHGKGTYLSPLGVKYSGLWKNGFENGQGTKTHPNGMSSVGEFHDGHPWNTVAYNKNGKIIFKVINGKIHKMNNN